MRVAKEQVDRKMSIPGATIRQRTDFGDATGRSESVSVRAPELVTRHMHLSPIARNVEIAD